MGLATILVASTLSGLLLWAGLEKARSPGRFLATLVELGVPRRLGRVAAALVIALELASAVALIARPHAAATSMAMLALAAAFAIAGLIALRRGRAIRCACFGTSGGRLGWSQLAAFPVWLAAVAFLRSPGPPVSPLPAAFLLAVVALSMAGVRAVSVLGALRDAQGDRRSATRMLIWLRR